MKKVLKIIGIILLVIVVLIAAIAALLFYLSRQPAVADNYNEKIETGGAIEAKYAEMGPHDVSYLEQGGCTISRNMRSTIPPTSRAEMLHIPLSFIPTAPESWRQNIRRS